MSQEMQEMGLQEEMFEPAPVSIPGVTTPVETAEEERRDEERRQAVRLLLEHPLVSDRGPDPQTFALVRRYAPELQRWFADQLGYRLVVDPELARLHKRPAPGARPRPLRTRSGRDFDPRRYALLCLVLAALERLEVQTVLSELADQVALLAQSEEGLRNLDLESRGERQAFVDVVRVLVDLDVLSVTDGEDVAYVDRTGDALYDIHPRRLSQMLSVPVPEAPESLLRDGGADLDTYPDTDEGARRRARHRLMRRLVEEPVLYLDELEPGERDYLDHTRHYLVGQVERATGLTVEVRREGLAAIDPSGALTDLAFPANGTVAHAALLLAEELAGRGRRARDVDHEEGRESDSEAAPTVAPWSELEELARSWISRYRRYWSKEYTDDESEGARRLTADAVERLAAMGLVVRHAEGVQPRPAVARYRTVGAGEADEADEKDREAEDGAGSDSEPSLFGGAP